MSPNDLIKRFPIAINPSATANVKKTIQYNITNPLYVEIDNGTCTVHEGVIDKYDVRLTIGDDNLVALFKGELSGMVAFVTGKLKVEGDKMLAQRMPSYFDTSIILG
ncbi:MAG: SCP2 sterol-binding domain-containing protein [Burkholderiales bacterium]